MITGRIGRGLAVAGLGAALGLGGGAARMLAAASGCAAATYTGHVTLVVEHGDGQVTGLCIGFDGSSITGEQILEASGLEYATSGGYGALGDAVCQIGDEPAAYSSCLPSSGPYWMVFVSRGGGPWQAADRGVSTETFASGDAEGFRYDPQNGPDPPPSSPAGICAAALGGAAATPPARSDAAPTVTPGATAPASASVSPSPATAQAGVPSPTPAVITPAGITRAGAVRGAAISSRAAAAGGTGAAPALLLPAAIAGALAGLAAVQMLLRRRRT